MAKDDLFDPEILKQLDEVGANQEFGSNYTAQFKARLPRPAELFKQGFTNTLASARSIEEVYAMGQVVSESGFYKRDEAPSFWNAYHKRKRELGFSPSIYTRGTEELYTVPVSPRIVQASSRKGAGGQKVVRNQIGELFTLRQMQGLDPINYNEAIKGTSFTGFLNTHTDRPTSFLTYDIETTGLLRQLANKETGAQRGLLSIGMSVSGVDSLLLGEVAADRKHFGEVIEEQIIPRHQAMLGDEAKASLSSLFDPEKKGLFQYKSLQQEKEILEGFIGGLRSNKDAAILGFNIKQFDNPFMQMMAKRHGLEGELLEQTKGRQVVDVADYAKSFLSEQLGGKYAGWEEGVITKLKSSPSGWRQQALAHAFGFELKDANNVAHGALSEMAHTPLFDVKMTEHIYKTLTADKEGNTARQIWGSGGFKRYQEALEGFGQKLIPIKEFKDSMTVEREGKRFLNLPQRMLDNIQRNSIAAATEQKQSMIGSAAKAIWNNKGKVGLGLAAVGIIGSIASSLGGEYNTIEGMKHGGIAEGVRRSHTDFGSRSDREKLLTKKERTLPTEMMGVPLDQELLDFRREVMKVPEERIELERELKAREAEAAKRAGSFEEDDFTAKTNLEIDRIPGINYRNPSLRQINLSNFNISIEDADTVTLSRKGLRGLFSKDVSVRLAGIDAPETAAHEGDPLEPVRYKQDQPYGREAAAKFRDLIAEQDNLSLLIGGEKTYGRYVGALVGDNSVLNIEAARRGLAMALPFGSASEDVVYRGTVAEAEKKAQSEEQGLWRNARYKAIDAVQDIVGQSITFNTLSRKDKLAQNLNLTAYSSFIEDMGNEKRGLSPEEENIAQRIGYALQKSHGPKKRGYNKFDGLHPGSQGMGAQKMRQHSDFGSGWDAIRALSKTMYKGADDSFEQLTSSKAFREALERGLQESFKIGEGRFGEVYSHQTYIRHGFLNLRKTKFEFVSKQFGKKAVDASMEQEVKAAKALGDLSSPSYYGRASDLGRKERELYFEKFDNVTSLYKTDDNTGLVIKGKGLSEQEYANVYADVQEAHKRGWTHSDLHQENVVRTRDKEGNERIGILDWGNAGTFSKEAHYNPEILNYVNGKGVTAKGMAETLDLQRLYAHSQVGGIGSQFNIKGHMGINSMYNQSDYARLHNMVYNDIHELMNLTTPQLQKVAPTIRKTIEALGPEDAPHVRPILNAIHQKDVALIDLFKQKKTELLERKTQYVKDELDLALSHVPPKIEAIHPGADRSTMGAQSIAKGTKGQFKSGWTGVILGNQDFQEEAVEYGYGAYEEYQNYKAIQAGQRFNQIMGRSSTRMRGIKGDGTYNTIEGMHPSSLGLGAQMIKAISDFGSEWDPIFALAKMVYKNDAPEIAYRNLMNSSEFRGAITQARKAGGKLLPSQGAMSEVRFYSANIDIDGHKLDFEFVGKKIGGLATQGMAPEMRRKLFLNEMAAHEKMQLNESPSLYRIETRGASPDQWEEEVFMEKFNNLENLIKQDDITGVETFANPLSTKEHHALLKGVNRAHEKGITHTDLHGENVARVKDAQGNTRIAILDWGLANRHEKVGKIGGIGGDGAEYLFKDRLAGAAPNMSVHRYEELADLAAVKRLKEKLESRAVGVENNPGINELYMRYQDVDAHNALTPEELIAKTSGDQAIMNQTIWQGEEQSKIISGLKFFDSIANQPLTVPALKIKAPEEFSFPPVAGVSAPVIPFDQLLKNNMTPKATKQFQDLSKQSVGLPIKAAHNAIKHGGFSSNKVGP